MKASRLAVPAALLVQLTATREPAFCEPLVIRGISSPFSVALGDFNGDGRLDIVTASAGPSIGVALQGRDDRSAWKVSSIGMGVSCILVKTCDFNGDSVDDVAVADPETVAYVLLSRGDGTFRDPLGIVETRGSRCIAVGDWDGDARLDLASANDNFESVSVLRGDGAGGFSLFEKHNAVPPHSVETLDLNGDAMLDLLSGGGRRVEGSLLPFVGMGNGHFEPLEGIPAPCHEFISAGDANADGRGDAVVTCFDDEPHMGGVWLSDSNGGFRSAFSFETTQSAEAILTDLDHDGHEDLLVADAGNKSLLVYPGRVDGNFERPILVGPAGASPVFLAAGDLDRDGHDDVVVANGRSGTVSILWGFESWPYLSHEWPPYEIGAPNSGYSTIESVALADVDGTGLPDMLLESATAPEIAVYLDPGCGLPERPNHTVTTTERIGSGLLAVDFDGDGIPDLAGVDTVNRAVVIALLDKGGALRSETSYPLDATPKAIAAGSINEDATVDLAAITRTGDDLLILLGAGGKLGRAQSWPTLSAPSSLAIGDLDHDGLGDVVVAGANSIGVHWGRGEGKLSPIDTWGAGLSARSVPCLADMDGDGNLDICFALGETTLVVFYGNGTRGFGDPVSLGVAPGHRIVSIVTTDVNVDGKLDATAAISGGGIDIWFNLRKGAFSEPAEILARPVPPLGHRFLDLDGDGDLDATVIGRTASSFLCGVSPDGPGAFRRGDVDGDAGITIADPILLLRRLFLGGSIACEDAADADDNGVLDLTDALYVLRWLFQGGPELPSPGASRCGPDPTIDDLARCRLPCR